jgi:hypothetical protein
VWEALNLNMVVGTEQARINAVQAAATESAPTPA